MTADALSVVITGPSAESIGGETVVSLAAAEPRTIFLCGRSQQRLRPVMEAFSASNSHTELVWIPMDLMDLDSVREAAAKISSQTSHVDVLFNNAGIMATMPYSTTKQGIESQFGVNHLAHFVFTARLMPLLLAAGAAIVNTASTGYQLGGIPFDDVNWSVSLFCSSCNRCSFFYIPRRRIVSGSSPC